MALSDELLLQLLCATKPEPLIKPQGGLVGIQIGANLASVAKLCVVCFKDEI